MVSWGGARISLLRGSVLSREYFPSSFADVVPSNINSGTEINQFISFSECFHSCRKYHVWDYCLKWVTLTEPARIKVGGWSVNAIPDLYGVAASVEMIHCTLHLIKVETGLQEYNVSVSMLNEWFQIGSASLGSHGNVGMDQMRHGLGSSPSAMQNCSPSSVVKQSSRPRMPPPSRVATLILC